MASLAPRNIVKQRPSTVTAMGQIYASFGQKQLIRKINKPMVEKKRRARINSSLQQLKTLVVTALSKTNSTKAKLEKADILEMTVKYIRNLQRQQYAYNTVADPGVVNKYRAGFLACIKEVSGFFSSIDTMDVETRARVLDHLATAMDATNASPIAKSHSYDNSNVERQQHAGKPLACKQLYSGPAQSSNGRAATGIAPDGQRDIATLSHDTNSFEIDNLPLSFESNYEHTSDATKAISNTLDVSKGGQNKTLSDSYSSNEFPTFGRIFQTSTMTSTTLPSITQAFGRKSAPVSRVDENNNNNSLPSPNMNLTIVASSSDKRTELPVNVTASGSHGWQCKLNNENQKPGRFEKMYNALQKAVYKSKNQSIRRGQGSTNNATQDSRECAVKSDVDELKTSGNIAEREAPLNGPIWNFYQRSLSQQNQQLFQQRQPYRLQAQPLMMPNLQQQRENVWRPW